MLPADLDLPPPSAAPPASTELAKAHIINTSPATASR